MAGELVLAFIVAAFFSFAGSLQPGPVNLFVIQASYSTNFRSAVLVAIGGSIPELIYSAVAVWFSFVFISHPYLSKIVQLTYAPFLFFSGIVLFRKSNALFPVKKRKPANFLLSGFFLGLLNPMLFTFWLFVISYIQNRHLAHLVSFGEQLAFIIGTSVGAFLLLMLFAYVAHKKKNFFQKQVSSVANKIIGSIFLLLSLNELYKLL